jgi:hypothetical protein
MEANRLRIPFAGHVPEAVSADETSQAGQKSLEHLFGVLMACAAGERELRGRIRPDPVGREFPAYETILAAFSDRAAAGLLEEFRRNGTWQTPTLKIWSVRASLDDPRMYRDPALAYVSRSMMAEWNPKTDYRLRDMTTADIVLAKRLLLQCLRRSVPRGARPRRAAPALLPAQASGARLAGVVANQSSLPCGPPKWRARFSEATG